MEGNKKNDTHTENSSPTPLEVRREARAPDLCPLLEEKAAHHLYWWQVQDSMEKRLEGIWRTTSTASKTKEEKT